MTTMQRLVRSAITIWLVPSLLGWCGIWLAIGLAERWNEERRWNDVETAVTRYASSVQNARCLERVFDAEFARLHATLSLGSARDERLRIERMFPADSVRVFLFDGHGRSVGSSDENEARVVDELFRFVRLPWSEPATLTAEFAQHAAPRLYDGEGVAGMLRGRPRRLMEFHHPKSLVQGVPQQGYFDWRPETPIDRFAGILVLVDPDRFEPDTIPRMALEGPAPDHGFVACLLPDGRFHATASAPADLVTGIGSLFKKIPTGRFRYGTMLSAARQVRGGIVLMAAAPAVSSMGGYLPSLSLAYAAGSLLLLALLWSILSGRLLVKISVTGKLAGLFLLGLGFPLAVSSILAGLYLYEKRAELLEAHRASAQTRLEQLDNGLETTIVRRQRLYRRLRPEKGEEPPTPAKLAALLAPLEQAMLLDAHEIIASEGEPLLSSRFQLPAAFRRAMLEPSGHRHRLLEIETAFDGRLEPDQVDGLLGRLPLPLLVNRRRIETRNHDDAVASSMRMLTRALLALHDRRQGKNLDDTKATAVLAGIDDSFLVIMNGILYYSGHIILSQGFVGHNYLYLDIFTRPTGQGASLMMLTHAAFNLQYEYLTRLFASPLIRHAGGHIHAVTDGEPFSPSFPRIEDRLRFRHVLDELRSSGNRVLSRRSDIGGEAFDITAVRGMKTKNIVWLHVTPVSRLDGLLTPFRVRIASFLAGTALFGLCLAYLLARLFLVPVRDLSTGVRALRDHRYDHRVPVRRGDELGGLCETLNRTITHMAEMEMAAVIQETLLPAHDCTAGHITVTGSNRMTQAIGGDYFDYLPFPDGRVAVVLGDVAGHGVSAALVTAMAKAAFTLLMPRFPDRPDEVLRRINDQFLAILRKKKMMSCCILIVDAATGRCRIANAGQCSPVLVDLENGARPVDCPAHPLGCVKKPNLATCSLDLPGNGCVVLHSDGLVEALDRHGTPVDYDRFYRFIAEGWTERTTCTDVIPRILDRVRAVTDPVPWADDATIVLIGFRG